MRNNADDDNCPPYLRLFLWYCRACYIFNFLMCHRRMRASEQMLAKNIWSGEQKNSNCYPFHTHTPHALYSPSNTHLRHHLFAIDIRRILPLSELIHPLPSLDFSCIHNLLLTQPKRPPSFVKVRPSGQPRHTQMNGNINNNKDLCSLSPKLIPSYFVCIIHSCLPEILVPAEPTPTTNSRNSTNTGNKEHR